MFVAACSMGSAILVEESLHEGSFCPWGLEESLDLAFGHRSWDRSGSPGTDEEVGLRPMRSARLTGRPRGWKEWTL